MTSQEKYSAMSYEKLADYVVLGGPDAPFEGIIIENFLLSVDSG